MALQKSNAVDVIDTSTNEVIKTLRIGQDLRVLVYVAGAAPAGGGRENLTAQGLNKRIQNYMIDVSQIGGEAKGTVSVREVASLDEIDIMASMLPLNQTFTVYASDGTKPVALRDVTSNEMGSVVEELAFAKFFDNGYDRVTLAPAMPDTGGA